MYTILYFARITFQFTTLQCTQSEVSMTTTVMLQFEIHSIHSKLMYSWRKKICLKFTALYEKDFTTMTTNFTLFLSLWKFVKEVLLESNEIKKNDHFQ